MDFISILSVFVLACFVGYYVVWSVTPALHTPQPTDLQSPRLPQFFRASFRAPLFSAAFPRFLATARADLP